MAEVINIAAAEAEITRLLRLELELIEREGLIGPINDFYLEIVLTSGELGDSVFEIDLGGKTKARGHCNSSMNQSVEGRKYDEIATAVWGEDPASFVAGLSAKVLEILIVQGRLPMMSDDTT